MQYGEIVQLGRHRLMRGDATKYEDIEALIDGSKVDLVLTDPPYRKTARKPLALPMGMNGLHVNSLGGLA